MNKKSTTDNINDTMSTSNNTTVDDISAGMEELVYQLM